MKSKDKNHSKTAEKGTSDTLFSQNNTGTIGHVPSEYVEGKGSFKKIKDLVEKGRGPNVDGIGENEEDHSTKL
ncbi:MAG: hypothetical protein H7Y07_08745 [Pyrinomonadaceae bacterium]|nr:hypothetical protein [Sphingobacteriaceae bacterium]